jgi:hypothetical protein
MRVIFTDEMKKLREIYKPYEIGGKLSKDAPPEAIEAEKKFMELFRAERERNTRLDLL